MSAMPSTEHDIQEQPEDDTLTFSVKRSHFYAVMVPLAFLLGMAAGYVIRDSSQTASGGNQAIALDSGQASQQSQAEPAAQAVQPTQSVEDQIAGLRRYEITIEDNDPINGPEDAPITIIEFADFECPFCQRHFSHVYPRLQAEYPDLIRYVYKDFPLISIHPNALPAALAAQCALEQDAFWPFHDLLFSGRLGLSRASYEEYASELELDTEAFAACLDEERYLEAVQADSSQAQGIGVSSTPTFFVNGIGVIGAQPFEVFAQIIDYELERLEAEEN